MNAKKYLGVTLLTLFLYSCDSHTYEELEETPPVVVGKVTYDAQVKAVIDNYCINCHSQNGSMPYRMLTNYAEVKDAIENTDLIDRIQRENGEPGQMPQGGRMPQGQINLILQWNTDGLLEN